MMVSAQPPWPDFAAASIEAVSGIPVHMTVGGHNVVLVSEEQFRTLAATRRHGRKGQRICRSMSMVELSKLIGAEQANRLAYARRHNPRVIVSAMLSDDHWLVRLIGRFAADLLCAALHASGTERVTLMLPAVSMPGHFYAEARQKAAAMTASGLSARVIAQTLGVSPRAVEKWRAKARADAAIRINDRRRRPSQFKRKRIEDDV